MLHFQFGNLHLPIHSYHYFFKIKMKLIRLAAVIGGVLLLKYDQKVTHKIECFFAHLWSS